RVTDPSSITQPPGPQSALGSQLSIMATFSPSDDATTLALVAGKRAPRPSVTASKTSLLRIHTSTALRSTRHGNAAAVARGSSMPSSRSLRKLRIQVVRVHSGPSGGRIVAKRVFAGVVLSAVFLGAIAVSLVAQGTNPPTYSQMRWRSIGPPRAGRARALSGVPSQPNVFYIGFYNGGRWRSTRFRTTLTPLFRIH